MPKYIWLSHILSRKISGYGNYGSIKVNKIKSISRGDSCNLSEFTMSVHLGTHVDLPRHFLKCGPAIEKFKAGCFVFNNVSVAHIKGNIKNKIISFNEVCCQVSKDSDLLLIKTDFSKFRHDRSYWEDNPGLHPDIPEKLKKSFPKIRGVGMDFISVSSWSNRQLGAIAHRKFLSNRSGRCLLIIEDMDLSKINYNSYLKQVVVSPLRIDSVEGAPCSIIAQVS